MPRVYAGLTAIERTGTRRRQFLDAGLQLLGTVGFANTTVRGVCDEARLSTRFFYEAFTGLDDLAVAVFDEIIDDVFARVATAVTEGEDRGARAHHAIAAMVAGLTDDPRRGRVVMTGGSANDPLARRRTTTMARLADAIELIGRTEYPMTESDTPLARVTATLVAGGVAELMTAWIDGRLGVDREHLIRDLARLAIRIGDTAAELAREE